MGSFSNVIRREFERSDIKRDEGLTIPEDIRRFDDLLYGISRTEQVLDVYKPKDKVNDILPVIISVHGGAYVYGDKERYQFYCMSLARRGFAVVNFTYRLAPEHRFPSSIEDTCMVFNWVIEHANIYGFDINHIFAVGDSAGAHILLTACAMVTDMEYRKNFSVSIDERFSLKAVALNCGIQVIDMSDQFTRRIMQEYLEHGGTEEELAKVNAIRYINESFPPVFIMTADDDFLKNQQTELTEKLIEKNVPFEFHFYKDPNVKLGHVFHLNMRLDAATCCNEEECQFFRRFIH